MNIVICGAGEVGRHAAEVLGAMGHSVTIVDANAEKLAALDEVMDVRNLLGSGTHVDVLVEAGCENADVFIAATNIDEINLLSASLAAGVGAHRTIARVHHSAYFANPDFDYAAQFGIDHLVCPEYTTATAIAQSLRSPGAMAVERFARERIELQQVAVSDNASVIGKSLPDLGLPPATRLALVERKETTFIPNGSTVIEQGDIVTLIGDTEAIEKARKKFHTSHDRRKRVLIMGGTGMGVWLCRALRSPMFSVRLIEENRERAEELAAKLDWATIICSNMNDADVLDEERVDQCDSFIALTADDEMNILLAARAKSMGATDVIAVQQRSTYLHLLRHVGIDRAFSPRKTAVSQIQNMLEPGPIRHLASLDVGVADVFEIRVPTQANGVSGKPLRDIKFPSGSMVAAIQRGEEVFVPGAMDLIEGDDTVVVIGPASAEKQLRKVFSVK